MSQFPFGDEKHLRVARDGSWSGPRAKRSFRLVIGGLFPSHTLALLGMCRKHPELHFSSLVALILTPEFNQLSFQKHFKFNIEVMMVRESAIAQFKTRRRIRRSLGW